MWIIILLLGTIISFWISAICGGGASLVLIPLLNLSLVGSQVPAALTIGTFTSSSSRLLLFKKSICWKIVMYYVPAALPAVWLGAWALKYFNPLYLQFFVGAFLLVNVRYLFLSKGKLRQNEESAPRYILLIIGALAGFISGLTGAVGLLFNRFYLQYGLSKEEIVATRAANDIIVHLIKLVLYSTMGLMTLKTIEVGGIIALGAIISTYSVKYILPLLSEHLFRRIGYGAMAVSGLILLTSTSSNILKADNPSVHFKPLGNSLETQLAWRSSHITIELEYDKGFELEQRISFNELPIHLQSSIEKLTRNADEVMYEKVTSFNGTSYEVYITKNGKVFKHDFQ